MCKFLQIGALYADGLEKPPKFANRVTSLAKSVRAEAMAGSARRVFSRFALPMSANDLKVENATERLGCTWH
jgi:hypothetical protein